MIISSNLGFPRIGPRRELKKAVEAFWADQIDEASLQRTCQTLRRQAWQWQKEAGIDHIPSNDFSLYDQVLDMAALAGAIPSRFGEEGGPVSLATYFAMARGATRQPAEPVPALEMTKWFDSNYHYLVPEWSPQQRFRLSSTKPIDEFLEARALGIHTRPVLLGPVTLLLLGKSHRSGFENLSLLESLLSVYEELLDRLAQAGADWIQFDEPCLATDLDAAACSALERTYQRLAQVSSLLKLLVATYFGPLGENLATALRLPVQALHLDLVRGRQQLDAALHSLPEGMTLSLGVVDGRNVWKTDLAKALVPVQQAVNALGADRVFVGPSCSLLHVPVDLAQETRLARPVCDWLAFARQKLAEIGTLARAATSEEPFVAAQIAENSRVIESRRESSLTYNAQLRERLATITPHMMRRLSPYPQRRLTQQTALHLPLLPTTTIGSFPQTVEIRKARAQFRCGELTQEQYEAFLGQTLRETIRFQEEIGLDVLVHGEAERTDMVEYFGERLDGFAITEHGWVQSYGSRCVKPPILYGDVIRREPMTVRWIEDAMAWTAKPVKGMLTGPVTILGWSFVRDDQPRAETCRQLALALRDEVCDLEAAGVAIIQIDEPAFREGLPLRRAERPEYLRWAVECFRLASSGVADATQIHTHMCYSDFQDILESVADLDADVISIETARSNMELLTAFHAYHYPNEIGPGIYDIHSPQIPSVASIQSLLEKALEVLQPEQIWVNPDCGLKTRNWPEIGEALRNMVAAARSLRERLQS